MSIIRYMLRSHRFFLRESYHYSGVAFAKHPIRWLRAYTRSMKSAFKDALFEKL